MKTNMLLLLGLWPALAMAQSALDRKPESAGKLASDRVSVFGRTAATPAPRVSTVPTAQAMNDAVAAHPDLAVSGSELSTRFVAAVETRRRDDPAFFRAADWPTRLAAEIELELISGELEGMLRVVGAVLQHTPDGLLVTTDARVPKEPFVSPLGKPVPPRVKLPRAEGVVLLKDHPDAGNLADDERVQAIAYPAGIYQYTSTLGGTKTVRAYSLKKP